MTTFPRAGAALVALGLLALPACAPNPGATAPNEPKPVAVTVAEAKSVALRRAVPVTGTLEPRTDALELTWMTPAEASSPSVHAEMEGGRGTLLRAALASVGVLG